MQTIPVRTTLASQDDVSANGGKVPVSLGGTNATTAAAARTALGLVIGTDVLAPGGSGASLTGITESQITGLVADLAAKAPLASPPLTGTPTAPTAGVGTNTTQIATTAFVLANAGSSTANVAFYTMCGGV